MSQSETGKPTHSLEELRRRLRITQSEIALCETGAYGDLKLWLYLLGWADWKCEESYLLKELERMATTEAYQEMTVAELEKEFGFLKPVGERVLVLEDPFKEPSVIIKTPESAKRRPTTGRVVAIGDINSEVTVEERNTDGVVVRSWKEMRPLFAVGDRVLYGQFSGQQVKFNQRPMLVVLKTDEVQCKILKEDEQLDTKRAYPTD